MSKDKYMKFVQICSMQLPYAVGISFTEEILVFLSNTGGCGSEKTPDLTSFQTVDILMC